jgi:hypothetical protein
MLDLPISEVLCFATGLFVFGTEIVVHFFPWYFPLQRKRWEPAADVPDFRYKLGKTYKDLPKFGHCSLLQAGSADVPEWRLQRLSSSQMP